MWTFTPTAYADYHSCIMENLTANFALVYQIPLVAGKQRPGLVVSPSLGWCRTTKVTVLEHTNRRKAT